jgi:hypothetical protein
MVNLPRFSTEVSSFIYEFLDQMFIEAQTRNEVACLSLTDDADIRKRKSLLLEKDFRDLLDDGIFGKDVLRVENMKDVGHIDEKEIETDNIWIRHLRSFERNHDVAFDLGIDNMIDEWTRMGDTPELQNVRLTITPPTRVSSMLFECVTRVVKEYVFDNPWIFMQNLLSRLQRSDVQYDLKAITIDVLVDLHITIDGKTIPKQKANVMKLLTSMFVHGSVRDTTDRPVTMLVPQSESGDLESVVDEFGQPSDVTQETNYSSEDEDAIDLMSPEELLEYHSSLEYLLSPITNPPDLVLVDQPLATLTDPVTKALYRSIHASTRNIV